MRMKATLLLTAALSCNANALDVKIRANPHVIDYVPSDLVAANVRLADKIKVMHDCGYADGQPGRCLSYCSDEDASCWVVRYLPSGTAERVYTVSGPSIELWLKVDAKNPYTVLFASERARKFAAEKSAAMLKGAPGSRAEGCEPYNGVERDRCEKLGPQSMRSPSAARATKQK